MEYNDNIIVNDRQSQCITNKFHDVHALEINDLVDIHTRMLMQCQALEKNNQSGKFSDAIAITTQNLRSLERIIGNRHRMQAYKYSLSSRDSSHSRIQQNDNDVYGKIPSHDEIMRMNPPLNTPGDIMPDTSRPENNLNNNINNNLNDNTNNNNSTNDNFSNNSGLFPNTGRPSINVPINMPDNNENSSPQIPKENGTSNNRRNTRVFPMQNSILSNLTQSLFMKKARKQNIDTASNNNENNSNNVKISSLTPRDIRNYFPYKNHRQDYLDNDCSNENSIYPKFPPYNKYYHEFMRSRVNGGGGHPWHYLNNCNDCDRDEDYNKHLKNINHLHNEYDKFKYSSYDYYEQNYDNDNCDQDRKIVTGQIDLLRLLVLFVALRPRCPYLTHICRIADEQFQVLIQLLN